MNMTDFMGIPPEEEDVPPGSDLPNITDVAEELGGSELPNMDPGGILNATPHPEAPEDTPSTFGTPFVPVAPPTPPPSTPTPTPPPPPSPPPPAAPPSQAGPSRLRPAPRTRRSRFGPGSPIVTNPSQLSEDERLDLIRQRLGY